MKQMPALKRDQLPAMIESVLFVAEDAVDTSTLAKVLDCRKPEINAALKQLEQRCAEGGTRLQRSNDLVKLVTAPEAGPYVERFLGLESRQRLSSAALESLAIIAYKQPTTRATVEQLRGVNSDGAIASLIVRGLVQEVGRAPGPGRPSLLGTSLRFLEHFGLARPEDLPPLPSPRATGDTLGEHRQEAADGNSAQPETADLEHEASVPALG
jgi:segregation and condensation protein B